MAGAGAEAAPSPHPSPAAAPPPAPRPSWLQRELLRHRRLLLALAATAILAIVGTWWVLAGRETTDDARFDGHVHPVAPRVGGTVLRIHVRENQAVRAGEILVELDPRDFEVVAERARADVAEAEAMAQAAATDVPIATTTTRSRLAGARAAAEDAEHGIEAAGDRIQVAEAQLRLATAGLRESEANYEKARQDLERMTALVVRDEVSRQEHDAAVAAEAAAQAAVESARAAQLAAREQIDIARLGLEQSRAGAARARAEVDAAATAPQQVAVIEARAASARARLARARSALEQALLDLEYASLEAPATGVVSRKSVELGQIVRPGQPLLAVVDLEDVWVRANFKETQLRRLRAGLPARVKVDAYPGRTLRGRVESIGAATTSRFSLLPAENATGNFVKVVQRVPVKIVLDEPRDPQRPHRPGMSVIATVLTRGEAKVAPEPIEVVPP